MEITIHGVPYAVAEDSTFDGKHTFVIENCFGTEGLNAVKKSNPWNEPEGEVLSVLVYVTDEEISLITEDFERCVEVIKEIASGFSSVGWEVLNPVKTN